jgi:hypothetical protein
MYNGSFVAVAREFDYVVGMADTRSYFVEKQLLASHVVTTQMF